MKSHNSAKTLRGNTRHHILKEIEEDPQTTPKGSSAKAATQCVVEKVVKEEYSYDASTWKYLCLIFRILNAALENDSAMIHSCT